MKMTALDYEVAATRALMERNRIIGLRDKAQEVAEGLIGHAEQKAAQNVVDLLSDQIDSLLKQSNSLRVLSCKAAKEESRGPR